MTVKHFLQPDHITVLIAIALLMLNLYLNERIVTLLSLILLVFAVIYDFFEVK
jgi:phosphatidylglycerophosphate synthase